MAEKTAKELWDELGAVPVTEDLETEEQFLHFPPGTDCHDIWLWFENKFDLSVTTLMFQKDENNS